jgi:hypothetical protein
MDINFLTMESLILAQDERWRRASYMQSELRIGFRDLLAFAGSLLAVLPIVTRV